MYGKYLVYVRQRDCWLSATEVEKFMTIYSQGHTHIVYEVIVNIINI